jgi:hypothetical protein
MGKAATTTGLGLTMLLSSTMTAMPINTAKTMMMIGERFFISS